MVIEVEFDAWCQVGFYIFGRWPIQLMELIGAAKREMFQAAGFNPLDPQVRTGRRVFKLGARRFAVNYAIGEPYQAESGEPIQRLRVLRIDEA